MRVKRTLFILMLFWVSCSSAPKRDEESIDLSRAKEWLSAYCSKGPREVDGSLVFQAKTKEFKGQHPGSLHFGPGGSFVLEVTHILGGTLMKLESDGHSFSLSVPGHRKANRIGETRYLGIELPVLSQLLMGDLPCPAEWEKELIEGSGSTIQVSTPLWIWKFSRAIEGESRIPYGIDLTSRNEKAAVKTIELRFEDWDSQKHMARKVRVKTSEGELKWVWRSRDSAP